MGFITKPRRLPNGYRVFTGLHTEQLRLIRISLRRRLINTPDADDDIITVCGRLLTSLKQAEEKMGVITVYFPA
jgi:DNA-binding transcriptional MerR regulator